MTSLRGPGFSAIHVSALASRHVKVFRRTSARKFGAMLVNFFVILEESARASDPVRPGGGPSRRLDALGKPQLLKSYALLAEVVMNADCAALGKGYFRLINERRKRRFFLT